MSPGPLRILHLDDGRLWRGGQHQVFLLLRELKAIGVVQRLLAHEGSPLAVRARQIGIDVMSFRYRGELDLFAPGQVAEIARRFEADVLHAHTSHAHAIALRAVRRLPPPVRLVVTRRVDFPIRGWLSQRKYRHPRAHFIAISNGVREALLAGGVAPERISLVHSGVPSPDPESIVPRDAVRRELGIADDEIAIVNTGALTDHKGHRWLIDAAAQVVPAVPKARFHILGDGELHDALKAQIERLGLQDRVILHGFVDDARLKLKGFDLYVSSSHLEGLGTAVLDAMLAGLPVVAAAAGGVPDVVIDGETGRLVPPRDGRALADAILAALRDPETSNRLARQAMRHVEQRFSAASMAAGTLEVYRRLTESE